jgi:predicted amidophosphoribosyltransferase
MNDLILEHLTYPEICMGCSNKIYKNTILCKTCFKYMNKKMKKKILHVRIDIIMKKIQSKL